MPVTTEHTIPATSALFQQDQSILFTVNYWDTPFTSLEADVASNGITMDVREPLSGGGFALKTNLQAAAASAAYSTFTNTTYSKAVVTNGVTENLIGYWAGGAPGRHGASVNGRVAYHFRCYLRPVAGREWWSASAAPNFQLGYAGNGYVRVTKTISGTTTDVLAGGVAINGAMTEADFLANGMALSDAITTMNAGDYLDIYYIQDSESWGGFVFKAVLSGATAAASPILSSSLFDTGTRPTMQTVRSVENLSVEKTKGSATIASFDLPLINAAVDDDFGWEFVKVSADDPGLLRYHTGLGTTFDVRRGRLMRIKTGFVGEQYTTLVGFVDQISAPASGYVRVTVVSPEQRLVNQFIKNFPDRVSYMAYNFKKRAGTSEPVYDIPAYDNWPMEYALRDLLTRSGIDESVTRQALYVGVTGGTTAITMAGESFLKFRARTAPIINEGASNTPSKQLRLERPVHYGNAGAGYNSEKPADDEYIFKPENTKDVWSVCREITDRYGYNLWFDEFGHCVLAAVNTYGAVWDFNTSFGGAPTLVTNPSSYAGTYVQWTGTVSLISKSVTAARIDLIVPRGVSHGSWDYTVKSPLGVTVASGTIVPSLAAGSSDEFFYDFRTTATGVNNTVVTLYSGEYATYTVTLQSNGGAATRRLDGFLLWHTDPVRPRYSNTFSTQVNALSVEPEDTMQDMRNFVIVVGRRKAAVTDSTKFQDSQNNIGANLDAEFIVQSAVDVASITDPTAVNFIGYSKESIIYDNKITDDDFAGYLATTFVYRYRTPRPGATIEHTIFPVVKLHEPVYAVETKLKLLDAQAVLWITKVTHRYTKTRAVTILEATSYAPLPSYVPREDIDIDTYYGGNAVAGVKISYTSLTGETKTNMAPAVEYISDSADIVTYTGVPITAGSPEYLDMQTGKHWPPIPGTVFLMPNGGAATAGTSKVTNFTGTNMGGRSSVASPVLDNFQTLTSVSIDVKQQSGAPGVPGGFQTVLTLTLDQDVTKTWYYQFNSVTKVLTVHHNYTQGGLTNPPNQTVDVTVNWYTANKFSSRNWIADTPYHHFMNVDYRTGASQKRIYLPWKMGDNSSAYARNTGVTSYDVMYRRFGPVDGSSNFSDPYGGLSPFYDPYTSELGYLVNVQFDALVSGLYRISVRSVYDDTVVAWLTEPTEDPDDKEKHWAFFGAGTAKKLAWDGVDDVGTWNKRQSALYADAAHGAFEQEVQPVIGKGFYVWNKEEDRSSSFPTLALIAGAVDSVTGAPVFGQGTYAKWYVKFEVINDTLQTIADANQGVGGSAVLSKNVPRVVDTHSLPSAYNADCILDSGTATGTQTSSTLRDNSKSWGTNVWKGYTLELTGGTGSGQSKQIASNVSNIITIVGTWTTTPVNGSTTYRIVSPSGIVYTHLPKPTTVELHSIADYINASAYDETNPPTSDAGNWQTTPNTDAVFNNQKPVRVRFNVQARPGTLWSGNNNKIPFKLHRVAALTASIFDQFIVYDGVVYPGTTVEKRTVVNRKLCNTEHSLVFSDETWRFNTSLKQTTAGAGYEWVFLPRHFKKDFRGVPDESIQFGDYLQLEEVPQWANSRQVGGKRSRFQLAFMNYLFYLSAYTQDKSGRFTWCVNRSFLDRAKIIKNAFADWYDPASTATPRAAASSSTYRNEWPVDLNTQHRRSVICRQWSDEGTWRADQNTLWSFGGASSAGYELSRHKWKDHYPSSGAGTLNGINWSSITGGLQIDQHTKWYRDTRSNLPSDFGSPNLTRQLGNAAFTTAGTALGKWLWEDSPTWVPCVTRDFHGYFLLPPMVDKDGTVNYNSQYVYGQVDSRNYQSATNEGDDTASGQVWNAPTFDMNEAYSSADNGKVKFHGRQYVVDNEAGPLKGIVNANSLDYMRQDQMIHYEDLRGSFSRGPRPQEQPKKVSPVAPYYYNPYSYNSITHAKAYQNPAYPLYKASPTTAGWWDMRFRYEYLWESGSLFPTDLFGVTDFRGMSPGVGQLFPFAVLNSMFYDDGAWTGWKDDYSTTGTGDAAYKLYFSAPNGTTDVFATGRMPVAVGPQLREAASGGVLSTDMIFHLVLINERRSRII